MENLKISERQRHIIFKAAMRLTGLMEARVKRKKITAKKFYAQLK